MRLRQELTAYVKQGVLLSVDGELASPAEIADRCFCKEDSVYMPDYIEDDNGNLTELQYHQIKDY